VHVLTWLLILQKPLPRAMRMNPASPWLMDELWCGVMLRWYETGVPLTYAMTM